MSKSKQNNILGKGKNILLNDEKRYEALNEQLTKAKCTATFEPLTCTKSYLKDLMSRKGVDLYVVDDKDVKNTLKSLPFYTIDVDGDSDEVVKFLQHDLNVKKSDLVVFGFNISKDSDNVVNLVPTPKGKDVYKESDFFFVSSKEYLKEINPNCSLREILGDLTDTVLLLIEFFNGIVNNSLYSTEIKSIEDKSSKIKYFNTNGDMDTLYNNLVRYGFFSYNN